MARRAWLIDSRGIAGKVKNASQYSPYQRQECGASLECPNCHRHIDNSDVSVEWPGLPAGVKFDPSDVELLEHLAGKLGLANSKPHMFIDEFIPTLEVHEGICYSHPADLPGAKKDGSSVHFFHRTSKAYATGPRKRRRIQGQCSSEKNHERWHKTGKTKAVIENGVQKGCKKIMVLYKSSKKGSKPDKSKWVMHQYHLGTNDEETEGEFVVSKIFYQQHPKQTEKSDIDPTSEEPVALAADTISEETVVLAAQTSPRTPNTNTPNPPRSEKRALFDQVDTEYLHYSHAQDAEFMPEGTQLPQEAVEIGNEIGTQLPPEAVEIGNEIGTQLPPEAVEIGNEIGTQLPPEAVQLGDESVDSVWWPDHSLLCDEIPGAACSISDLDDLELGDLQFGSQDSIVRWLDGWR